jgi:hypothetical protein
MFAYCYNLGNKMTRLGEGANMLSILASKLTDCDGMFRYGNG